MSGNYFTDYKERIQIIKETSDVRKIAIPKEECFGDEESFKTSEEAMDFFMGALEEIGRFCANDVAASAKEIDEQGISFKNGRATLPEKLQQNIEFAKQLGIFLGEQTRPHGGLNMPRAINAIILEMLAQACPNTGLTVASYQMAPFLEEYGTKKQIEKYLPDMMDLKCRPSMALTEADAGSDLGSIRTVAKKEGDHWIVNGTKQFITNGDAELSFVLARTDPNSKGLEGLSVLLVPRDIKGREKPNIVATKVEEKICLHASPTCEMVFEDSIGYMFGGENKGFKVMASLMNGARLAMGPLALGICASAHEKAKQYAKERVTMGKPIIEHPMVADMLYEMEIEIRAMRALVIEACCAADWEAIYRHKGDRVNEKRWQKRYRRLTPLVKYLTSEKAVEITRKAVQILGGYGVCRDYPVERLYRESIIYPIYEGTSQIQALMALKDTLKDVATQAPGFLGSLAGAWAQSKVTRDPIRAKLLEARNELNQGINNVLKDLLKQKFKSDITSLKEKKIQKFISKYSLRLLTPDTDLSIPFLCAERLTRIVCDYYALKCMADQLDPKDKEGERWVLEFAALAIPRMRLENEYMVNRLPSTLDYIQREISEDVTGIAREN